MESARFSVAFYDIVMVLLDLCFDPLQNSGSVFPRECGLLWLRLFLVRPTYSKLLPAYKGTPMPLAQNLLLPVLTVWVRPCAGLIVSVIIGTARDHQGATQILNILMSQG